MIQRNCSSKLIIPLKHIFTYRDKKNASDCLIANRNKMFYLLSALLLSRTNSNHSTMSSKNVNQLDFLTFIRKKLAFIFKIRWTYNFYLIRLEKNASKFTSDANWRESSVLDDLSFAWWVEGRVRWPDNLSSSLCPERSGSETRGPLPPCLEVLRLKKYYRDLNYHRYYLIDCHCLEEFLQFLTE